MAKEKFSAYLERNGDVTISTDKVYCVELWTKDGYVKYVPIILYDGWTCNARDLTSGKLYELSMTPQQIRESVKHTIIEFPFGKEYPEYERKPVLILPLICLDKGKIINNEQEFYKYGGKNYDAKKMYIRRILTGVSQTDKPRRKEDIEYIRQHKPRTFKKIVRIAGKMTEIANRTRHQANLAEQRYCGNPRQPVAAYAPGFEKSN